MVCLGFKPRVGEDKTAGAREYLCYHTYHDHILRLSQFVLSLLIDWKRKKLLI